MGVEMVTKHLSWPETSPDVGWWNPPNQRRARRTSSWHILLPLGGNREQRGSILLRGISKSTVGTWPGVRGHQASSTG